MNKKGVGVVLALLGVLVLILLPFALELLSNSGRETEPVPKQTETETLSNATVPLSEGNPDSPDPVNDGRKQMRMVCICAGIWVVAGLVFLLLFSRKKKKEAA